MRSTAEENKLLNKGGTRARNSAKVPVFALACSCISSSRSRNSSKEKATAAQSARPVPALTFGSKDGAEIDNPFHIQDLHLKINGD
jgi:hypothetical protein